MEGSWHTTSSSTAIQSNSKFQYTAFACLDVSVLFIPILHLNPQFILNETGLPFSPLNLNKNNSKFTTGLDAVWHCQFHRSNAAQRGTTIGQNVE
jgi:hypothetical protein